MGISVNGINHVAMSVADLEESIEWYKKVFGFSLVKRSEIPGTGTSVAHLQAPGFQLELFCNPGSESLPDWRRFPNEDFMHQGNLHASFGVKDAHSLKDRLDEMGVNIAFVAEVDGTYAIFINDNTGNLIELFEEGR